MNRFGFRSLIMSVIASSILLQNCQQAPAKEELPKIPPVVLTGQVRHIDDYSVAITAEVTTDGNAQVSERGIVYGTAPNLTAANDKVTGGTGTGPFEVTLANLSPGTSYYFKAYAINSAGTAYGTESTFSMSALLPQVTTANITAIGMNAASSGGEVTSDGGSPVILRGVCWSKNPSPTINDVKSSDGPGKGAFVSSLTGLTDLTTYYVRAYAINSVGTGYGPQVTFTTTGLYAPGGGATDIDGNQYQTIIINGQEWMKKNLGVHRYRNGDAIENALDPAAWRNNTTGAYIEVGYNSSHGPVNDYGALYNWFAVSDPRGLCPTGFHVPSDADWTKLTDFLGGIDNPSGAANKLKATGTSYWVAPNERATNQSGFTALPGGFRDNTFGNYYHVDVNGFWWSSTEDPSSPNDAWDRRLYSNFDVGDRGRINKATGLSVRCVKN